MRGVMVPDADAEQDVTMGPTARDYEEDEQVNDASQDPVDKGAAVENQITEAMGEDTVPSTQK